MAVSDFFDRGWRHNPRGPAYVMGDRVLTFEEAGTLSCRIANALLGAGFAKPAKAAVLSPNDPVAWICVLGIWRAGLTWVPLNPANPAVDTQRLVDGFDCEVLFFHSAAASVVEEMRPSLAKVRQYVSERQKFERLLDQREQAAARFLSRCPQYLRDATGCLKRTGLTCWSLRVILILPLHQHLQL